MSHLNLKKRRLIKIIRFADQAFRFKEMASAYGPMSWVACGTLIFSLPALAQYPWLAMASIALFASLACIAFFDAMYFIVPDRCLVFAAMIGIAQTLPKGLEPSVQALSAAITGYAMIRLLMTGYEKLRGEPGMGHGDAKLFSVAGLWTGFEGLGGCLLYAVVSALLSILIMQYRGAKLNARTAIPFGPHLAFGFWLVWSVGPLILMLT